MANLLQDIADFLETNGLGMGGTDIFVGFMPDGGADNVIMIDQTGGVQPDRDLPVSKPTVQIQVRDVDYISGINRLQAIYDLFHRMNDGDKLTEAGVDIMRVFAMNEPQHLERDNQERDLFTCTFVFQLRK